MGTAGDPTPDLRPLRVGEILDVGIKIYTRNAKTLFFLVALVVIPVQVIGVLIIMSTIPDEIPTVSQNPFDLNSDVAAALDFGLGDLVVLVLGFVSTAIVTAACFKAVADAYLGGSADWRSSLRFTLRHGLPLLWVTLLTVLGTLVGFVLCILPGIWLGIVWSVAIPVLLTEETRGTKALGRSFDLVQSRFWPASGVIIVSYLIELVLNAAIGGGIAVLLFTDVGRNIVLMTVLSGIAGTIAAILATPFRAAVTAVLYFDLRVRKEGFDLQLLAQRMGSADPERAHAALLPPPIPTVPSYPSGYPPGMPPPPTFGPPPVNGLAIASLISSLVLCIGSIPGVIMGHMSLARIDRSQGAEGGRGIALAGTIIGWIGVAILTLIVVGIIAAG